MERDLLCLKPGVQSVEERGRLGLTLSGQTLLTSDPGQSALLQALLSGAQPLETLKFLLRGGRTPPGGDAYAALALADFILQFKDFLQP